MEDPDEAEAVLSAAVKLRRTWLQLLELKLEGKGDRLSPIANIEMRQSFNIYIHIITNHCQITYSFQTLHLGEV